MKCSIFYFVAALGFASFAFGQGYVTGPTEANLTVSFQTASESLGKMGLGIERVGSREFSGKPAAAVPRSAILEEEGKTFVVVLDARDPAKSERLEVVLGESSGDYVQARNGVFPGACLVVRKDGNLAKKEAPPARAAEPPAQTPKAKPIRAFENELLKIRSREFPVAVRESARDRNPAPVDDRFHEAGRPQPAGRVCEFCNEFHPAETPANLYPAPRIETGLERIPEWGLPVLHREGECAFSRELLSDPSPTREYDAWRRR